MKRPSGEVDVEEPEGRAPPTAMPWLSDALRPALADERSHAILVHGPSGVGQWRAALAAAQAWLCESSVPRDARPCGCCASCRLARAWTHPDLLVVVPDAERDVLGLPALPSRSESETKKASLWIRIEQTRRAVTFATTTSARGRGKAIVVYPVDRMQETAATALLKTLEEPPGASRLILAGAQVGRLLPTIRSRCTAVRLPLPPRDEALAWLAGEGVRGGAGDLLDACGGQPEDALARHRDGVDGAALAALPERIGRGDADALRGLPLPVAVELLQRLCVDALAAACGRPPRHFPRARLDRFAAVASGNLDALTAWSRALGREAEAASHPWHAELAGESLAQQSARALNTPRSASPKAADASIHSAA